MKREFRYDLIRAKKIQRELNSIIGLKILNMYYFDESLVKPYEEALHRIIAIDYPVSIELNRTNLYVDVIEKIYAPYNYNKDRSNFRWLIPYFGGSMWWIKFEITDVKVTSNCLLKDKLFETVIDLEYNFVFDIEVSDEKYFIRLLNLK